MDQPCFFLDPAPSKWGGGHGARPMSNAHVPSRLPSPLFRERAAAQNYEICGYSKNWNFSDTSMS